MDPRDEVAVDRLAYAEALTKYDDSGNLVQLGFLPQEPGRFIWAWGFWFGGRLIDENGNITFSFTLDGNYRPNYTIKALDSENEVVAEYSFTDDDVCPVISWAFTDSKGNWVHTDNK